MIKRTLKRFRRFTIFALTGIMLTTFGMNVSAAGETGEGQQVSEEEKLLIDTGCGESYYKESGTGWSDSGVKGYDGTGTRYSLSQYAAAEWYPVVAETGEYQVRLYHPVHNTDVSNDVKIQFFDPEGVELYSEEMVWDGTEASDWIDLGSYELEPGKYTVKLSKQGQQENPNQPGSHDQALRADAVELVKADTASDLPEAGKDKELIIDYGENGYAESGTWSDSGKTGYNGSKSRYTDVKGSMAEWKAKIRDAGTYQVYLYRIPDETSGSTQVRVSVTGGNAGLDEIQDWKNADSGWKLMGEYTFTAGDIWGVNVTNLYEYKNVYTRVDSVKIVYCPEKAEITEMEKADYYVDAAGGNDQNAGTSPDAAWKTLEKVNSCAFAPGSRILLKRGESWNGRLAPQGSGTAEEPIIMSSYGDGEARPAIHGNGCADGAVGLYNQEYWEISELEVTNSLPGEVLGDASNNTSARHGIYVELEKFEEQGDNTAEHIYVKDCYVHDVVGNLGNPHNGVGIFYFVSDAGDRSRFHDILIDGNDVRHVDRSGIIIRSQDTSDPDKSYNTGVVIQNNYVEDIAGDGIVAKVSTGAMIQYNEVNTACARPTGGNVNNAAVWVWQCKDSVIQYNEVYNTGLKGGNKDGQAFDSDFNCEGCVIQYNYSHDNDGGFVLVIAPSARDFNRDTVVRYNISENDKKDVMEVSGAVEGAKIYNNTVYQGPDCPTNLLRVNTYFGVTDSFLIQNNLFHSDADDTTTMTENDNGRPFRGNIIFDHNLFYGFPVPESADEEVDEIVGGVHYTGHWKRTIENTVEGDALLGAPGKDGTGVDFDDPDRLSGYFIAEDSPAIDAGTSVAENGGKDFWGSSLYYGDPDIGAHEYRNNAGQNPEEPGNPDEPGNPEEPGNPDEPGNPGNPEEPGNPEKPGNPEEPGNPEKPGISENPNNQEKPVNQEGMGAAGQKKTAIQTGDNTIFLQGISAIMIVTLGAAIWALYSLKRRKR